MAKSNSSLQIVYCCTLKCDKAICLINIFDENCWKRAVCFRKPNKKSLARSNRTILVAN